MAPACEALKGSIHRGQQGATQARSWPGGRTWGHCFTAQTFSSAAGTASWRGRWCRLHSSVTAATEFENGGDGRFHTVAFHPTGRQKLCLVSLRMLKIHAGFICFQGKNQASAAVTGIQRSRKLLLADDGKKGQMEPRVFRILCSPDLGLVPTGLS